MSTDNYGNYYFQITTKKEVIHCHAEKVEINNNGDLLLFSPNNLLITSFASGEWCHIFGADVLVGDPVNVEHWRSINE